MNEIKEQLKFTLNKLELDDNVGQYYRGKVRDNYYFDDKMLMVTTDRVSAFDHVLGTIPFKGQILTEIANFWFDKTKDIVPNHVISNPDPQVLISKKANTLPVEIIIRKYITGSLWREYSQGINGQYGFMLDSDLKENQEFESPIITPSTKAEYGQHDEPISRDEIIKDLVPEEIYSKAEEYALKLFDLGQKWANKMGLILVDTKYEFGLYNNELIVIDEIHTPDSSRYWIKDDYAHNFENNQPQNMLDKENIRQWLIEQGFKGEGTPPDLTDDIRILLSQKYIELYKKLTGNEFEPQVGDVKNRILANLSEKSVI
ncbi:MAG: phosphoribosylaminoimidazolesuccinocarboxamide synthase [Candidatus Marinimicrobia bacterium]|nr:phosphoribosylaminoimidazolesuccinocarboxamide synthase [Candidatus Neomarinimicrobiota bacterium]|tara:strand:- start:33784 stop:34731 length:948 start_codon:yes stop_codon:yes gene_type:complete